MADERVEGVDSCPWGVSWEPRGARLWERGPAKAWEENNWGIGGTAEAAAGEELELDECGKGAGIANCSLGRPLGCGVVGEWIAGMLVKGALGRFEGRDGSGSGMRTMILPDSSIGKPKSLYRPG